MSKNKKGFFQKLKNIITIRNQTDTNSEVEDVIEDDYQENSILCEEEEEGQLSVDMFQTNSEIIIQTMVAGVKPEDLDISITRDMVTIRGKRAEAFKVDDFFHRELYWGAFSRTIILPSEVEIEEAEASEKHGLLTLVLPKIDKNRQSKLKVKNN